MCGRNIDSLMRLYSRYLQGKGNALAVSFSGEWIYRSPAFASEENMICPPDTGYSQERLVYMENGKHPVMCVYGSFPAPWQDYRGILKLFNLGFYLFCHKIKMVCHTGNFILSLNWNPTAVISICNLCRCTGNLSRRAKNNIQELKQLFLKRGKKPLNRKKKRKHQHRKINQILLFQC